MLPDTLSIFGHNTDGNFTLPAGALFIKHFDFDQVRGNPATAKRLETRLLMINTTGAYGVSYRWDDQGTDATLVDDAGVNFDLNITVNGSPYTQSWRIPSRAECMACHTQQGGLALSWETRQLNHSGTLGTQSGNYLTLLYNAGYLTNPGNPAQLPKYHTPTDTTQTLETRARSWFAVNCSYCHQSGGTGVGSFDLNPWLNLTATGIINGNVSVALAADHKAIVRGQPAKSILYNRLALQNGYTRMPPLGSSEIDPAGSQLIHDWILESTNRSTYTEWRLAHFGSTTSPAGDPTADPDTDGHSNYTEWLGLTTPTSGTSFLVPQISLGTGGQFQLSYPNHPGRLIRILSSTDLQSWSLWNHPDNTGLPAPGPGTLQYTAPLTDPRRFFRLEVKEQ